MKLSRLSGRKVNDYLRRKGEVFRGKTMTIRYLQKAPHHPNVDPEQPALYVGTQASAKLHKSAVKRNRMRRRCKEALRTTVADMQLKSPVQMILAPKSASLDCDFQEIIGDIEKFMRML